MSMSLYTPTNFQIVHYAYVDFVSRQIGRPVHIVQYDDSMPILAVRLFRDGKSYAVPEGADVNIRLNKPDGTFVYNPALGSNAGRETVYFEISPQMATYAGEADPVVEIVLNGSVASSSPISLMIDRNPVQDSDIESTSEYKSFIRHVLDAEAAAEAAADTITTVSNLEKSTKQHEDYARQYSEVAMDCMSDAEKWAGIAEDKAVDAEISANQASEHARQASAYKADASSYSSDASESAKLAQDYYQQAKDIKDSLDGALRPMRTVSFAALPALANVSIGDMYNISDVFTTTSDFEEGSGHNIPAGSNVYKTANGKWDVLAGSTVAGVKGSAEDSFRKGNVEITKSNIGLGNVDNTADANKNVASAKKLSVQPENWKQGNDLPSTYPQGETVFFSNNPSNRFKGISYCTIHTIKGYANMACIQFLYPYNSYPDNIYFREALSNTDIWSPWYEVITSENIANQSVASAVKATQDGNGNVIVDTYAMSSTVSSGDFNNFKTPGLYRVLGTSTMINSPFNSANGWSLIVTGSTDTQHGGVVMHQTAIPEHSNDVYVRSYYGGGWTSWVKLLALDSSGNTTITGNLRLKGSGAYGNILNFGDGDYVHISEPTDDNMEIKAKNVNFVITGNLSLNNKKILTIDQIYPVGSIYMSINSTNPGTLFGGTWEAWGQGRVPVGVTSSDTDFNSAGKTGGEKKHALTVSEMPSHSHSTTATTVTSTSNGAHKHELNFSRDATHSGNGQRIVSTGGESSSAFVNSNGAHTHSVTIPSLSTNSKGSDSAHENMPPYITCYMWKRTA